MGLLVMSVLKNVRYRFKELKEEKELTYRYDGYTKGGKKVPNIYRDGTPQGSPLSPILSTIALENWEFPEGLIMYADDGVFIGNDYSPLRRFI